jgi:hypothetical protein
MLWEDLELKQVGGTVTLKHKPTGLTTSSGFGHPSLAQRDCFTNLKAVLDTLAEPEPAEPHENFMAAWEWLRGFEWDESTPLRAAPQVIADARTRVNGLRGEQFERAHALLESAIRVLRAAGVRTKEDDHA